MSTVMPSLNPHRQSPGGHPGSLLTLSSDDTVGISAAIVVCATVCGMYMSVIPSVRKRRFPSSMAAFAPCLYGSTGAKKLFSAPACVPEYAPAPAIRMSLYSVSTPTRRRCCMSATSGCVWNVPCAGFMTAKMPAVTASMMVTDTSISTRLNPRSLAMLGRLPRLHRDDARFVRQPVHFPRIGRTAIRRARDQHLQHNRVVRIGRQRLDRPPADIGRPVRNRRAARADRLAVDVEI